jgi:glycosyltransferase involved in cell wall biosynthesis
MKILFVAMQDSVHTQGWISQLSNRGWEIYLFPSVDAPFNEVDKYKNVTIIQPFYNNRKIYYCNIFGSRIAEILRFGMQSLMKFIKLIFPNYHKNLLQKKIKAIRPDIIHSLEFQKAGYLVSDIKKEFSDKFPIWIVTSWGSDLYLFGRIDAHHDKVIDVLLNCDYYLSDCQRDVQLAKNYGVKGQILGVLPAAGGFDLNRFKQFNFIPPSKRKLILIKGYQGWAGRSFVALAAIKLCADVLKSYKIAIFLAGPDVEIAAELVSKDIQMPIEILEYNNHIDILKNCSEARVSIGLSISDGTPMSMLESMITGVFPIQSDTSCADEWITDGKNGLIVPPEDPEAIAVAIRRALIDDDLVDQASAINSIIAEQRLDQSVIQPKVIRMYEEIYAEVGL